MKLMKSIFLAGAAGLALTAAAQAADLPTKKAPAAPPAASCFSSFTSWLDATAKDCPLTFAGITVYGTIDVGAGYETNGARFNGAYPNGVSELISKFNNGAKWQWVPNGLSQSNLGVKVREEITKDWFLVGDVNFGFDPYSLQFASGPNSLLNNNDTKLAYQTANGDSSRTLGFINSRAYAGISNATLGTLTVGRQYSFTNEASAAYDPFGGAYAFSLIGTSGTVLAGTGDTETARYATSVKYQVAYNGIRAGALWQFGGLEQGNPSNGAFQADIGADFAGFSFDAIYAYDKDALVLKGYAGSLPTGVPDPANTLKAYLTDINAGVLTGKYVWNALTLYAGYEYAQLSTASDLYGASANGKSGGWYVNFVTSGSPGIVQANQYVNPEKLQVLWVGAKYALLSNLDIAGGYYYEWQNDYTNKYTSYNVPVSKANPKGTATGVGCGPNPTAAITGATPQGSNAAACAGNTDVFSAMLDWRPYKRLDVYGGFMYSLASGGQASGYIKNSNFAPTVGLRLSF